jgi:hypothetical protein
MSQSGKGAIYGQGNSLSGNFDIVGGQSVQLSGSFGPPTIPFAAQVILQYNSPSDLNGPYMISQGSQIGPTTINLNLISPDGSTTLRVFGQLNTVVPPVIQVTGQVFFTGLGGE